MHWSKDPSTGGSTTFGVRAAWAHEFASNDPIFTSFQSLPGVAFPVAPSSPDRNSVVLSATIGHAAANGFAIDGNLMVEASSNAQNYGGALAISNRWSPAQQRHAGDDLRMERRAPGVAPARYPLTNRRAGRSFCSGSAPFPATQHEAMT